MHSEQQGDDSYSQLLQLEELESLLEEIEESGAPEGTIPSGLRELLQSLGIESVSELVGRIAQLHAELDEVEAAEGRPEQD
jgi:hypothetical protein